MYQTERDGDKEGRSVSKNKADREGTWNGIWVNGSRSPFAIPLAIC